MRPGASAVLFAAIMWLTTACNPEREPTGGAPSPAAASSVQAPVAAPPAVDLAGEWRVAGIDGKPFDRPYGLALSATANEILWEPGCAAQRRGFTISGDNFRMDSPIPPGEVCDIAIPDELLQVWDVLSAASKIRRTPENGVLIEGGGRSVLLFSQ